MSGRRDRALGALLLLNVVLQAFDGLATHVGVSAGFPEGNPLVASAAARLGLGPTLVLFKLQACAWLGFIWALRGRTVLAGPALALSATVYLALSVGPWTALLLPVYLPSAS